MNKGGDGRLRKTIFETQGK